MVAARPVAMTTYEVWSWYCRRCDTLWSELFGTQEDAMHFAGVHHAWCSRYRRLPDAVQVQGTGPW